MTSVALSQTPYRFAVYTRGVDTGEYCWYECLNHNCDPNPYLEYIRANNLIKTNKTRLHVGFVDGSKVVIYQNYFSLDSVVNRSQLWTNAAQFVWIEEGYNGLMDLV